MTKRAFAQPYLAILGAFALILSGATGALAANFTEKEVRAFADAMPALHAFSEEMKAAGLDDLVEQDPVFEEDGSAKLFSGHLAKLKSEAPEYYKRYDTIAKDAGFSNATIFSEKADNILLAYMSKMIPPEAMAMMQSMSPQMMQMMPPEAKANFEQGQKIVKALSIVPEDDKAVMTDEVMAYLSDKMGVDEAFANMPNMSGMMGQ